MRAKVGDSGAVIGYIIAAYGVVSAAQAIGRFRVGRRTIKEVVIQRKTLETDDTKALGAPPVRIILLLPMLREQKEASDLLKRMDAFDYPSDQVVIVPITTERETAQTGCAPLSERETRSKVGEFFIRSMDTFRSPPLKALRRAVNEPTTSQIVLEELRRWRPRCVVVPLHSPNSSDTKATQLNYALRTLCRMGVLHASVDTYVGVYDADSAPDLSTLKVVASYASSRRPFALQQYAVYLRNGEQSRRLMRNEAVLQTAHSICMEYPRQRRVNCAIANNSSMGPTFTYCIGHGVFFRSDWLLRTGFAERTSLEDLSMGFMLALGRKEILPLPVFDTCTVPSSLRAFVFQTATWFNAQLEFREAVGAAKRHFGPVHPVRVWRGVIEQTFTNAKWLLDGPCRVLMLVAAILTGSWWGILALTSVWLGSAYLEWYIARQLVERCVAALKIPTFDWLSIVRPLLKSCGPCLVVLRGILGFPTVRSKTERT